MKVLSVQIIHLKNHWQVEKRKKSVGILT